MKNKKKKNITRYGEFVPTFHVWLGLSEQKQRAEEMENMTKKENNN